MKKPSESIKWGFYSRARSKQCVVYIVVPKQNNYYKIGPPIPQQNGASWPVDLKARGPEKCDAKGNLQISNEMKLDARESMS